MSKDAHDNMGLRHDAKGESNDHEEESEQLNKHMAHDDLHGSKQASYHGCGMPFMPKNHHGK